MIATEQCVQFDTKVNNSDIHITSIDEETIIQSIICYVDLDYYHLYQSRLIVVVDQQE